MMLELPGGLPTGGLVEPLLEGGERNAPRPPPRVVLEERQPYSSQWLSFLLTHYVPFLAQVLIMWTAFQAGARLICICAAAALAFSGLFYSYVAWHTDAPGFFKRGFLPLSERPLLLGILLAVPYGFLQWVIVALHLRSDAPTDNSRADLELALNEDGAAEDDVDNGKFVTFKAVNAIVESLFTSAAILYTHWTDGLPAYWTGGFHDHAFLMTFAELAILASGGLGLLHLDYVCSYTVRERMKDPKYLWIHCLFRMCEVISRLTILTGYAVMATFHSPWWWLLIVCEVGFSFILVVAHQGLRNTWPAISITVVSATIVNIFCFVDQPFRFEGACKVSAGLTAKHFVETVLAGIFMFCIMDVRLDISLHGVSLATAAAANLAYWVLWLCICRPWSQEPDPRDNIFSATQRGNLANLRRLLKEGPAHFDLNDFDIQGRTPLMYAAHDGNEDICSELLNRGASVLAKALDREGEAADHMAYLDEGPLDLTCCLGVRRWFWPPAGRQWSALHFAAHRGNIQALQRMLTHNGGLNYEQALRATDADKNTPLHVAGMFGQNEAYDLISQVGPQDWRYLPNAFREFPRRPVPKPVVLHGAVAGPMEAHGQPVEPEAPGLPVVPHLSGQPVEPQAPGQPVELEEPGLPVAPQASGQPVEPQAPGQPVELQERRAAEESPRELEATQVISVTYQNPRPHTVPLGLASFAVSSSSGQVGKLFKPPELMSEYSSAFEAWQRGEDRDVPLRFEDLEPCSADGTPMPWALPTDPMVFLGWGTFGIVWRACDHRGRTVAVKCLRNNAGDYPIALREAQVVLDMKAFPHPCLVQAFLYHQLSVSLCLVLELCHGGSLQDVILEACRNKPRTSGWCLDYQPPPDALRWLEEAFIGMEYVHRSRRINGIIRDFKTANVGLTYGGANPKNPRGRAKLLDFGSYRLTGPSLGANTFEGLSMGSPGYASPELLRNLHYKHHTDFYSFGMAIWVTLTGGYNHPSSPHQAQAWYTSSYRSVRDLQEDWRTMQVVAQDPRLPSLGAARPLVLQLIRLSPEKRGSHHEIRTALAQLSGRGRRLPPFLASANLHALEDALRAA